MRLRNTKDSIEATSLIYKLILVCLYYIFITQPKIATSWQTSNKMVICQLKLSDNICKIGCCTFQFQLQYFLLAAKIGT